MPSSHKSTGSIVVDAVAVAVVVVAVAVVSADVAALRMFGFGRREMLGQNITAIIPEPFSSFHQDKMRAYLRSGRSVEPVMPFSANCLHLNLNWVFALQCVVVRRAQIMLETSRVMFAKHRQGYIFPVLMNANMLACEFVGIIQKLTSVDEYILYHSGNLAIASATQGSLSAMEVMTSAGCEHEPYGSKSSITQSSLGNANRLALAQS